MEQNLKINQIISLTQKSNFGGGKYFGYNKEKFLGIIKITTNKKIAGYGETLVGVYSPKLFKINLAYISKFINKKNLYPALDELNKLKRNKFFFDCGILKSIIAGIEIAIFDILAQANNVSHGLVIKNYFKQKTKLSNNVEIYASAGSIKSSLKDLKNDINYAKKLNISTFKGRLAINKNTSKKINILKSEIDNFAVDLIANTYEKNQNLNNLKSFLNNIKNTKPVWLEEILNTDSLYEFKKIKKYGLPFSYGENYNTFTDFINLIEFYNFNFINPDLSHLSIFDFVSLNEYLNKKNYNKKIIIHCWGGAINFIYSLYCAQVFQKQVKLVEFPITESSFMEKVYPNISIVKSRCFIDDKVKSFKDIIDTSTLEKIKFSKLTFNFD
tara:strand:+ start:7486 stop:8640 length:1155 start_codon:yes stop_codon:yes gene_type:complete